MSLSSKNKRSANASQFFFFFSSKNMEELKGVFKEKLWGKTLSVQFCAKIYTVIQWET